MVKVKRCYANIDCMVSIVSWLPFQTDISAYFYHFAIIQRSYITVGTLILDCFMSDLSLEVKKNIGTKAACDLRP